MKNTSHQDGGNSLALSQLEHTTANHTQLEFQTVAKGSPTVKPSQINLLAIIDELIGYKCASPSRRIVTGSGKRVRGKFASRRFGALLSWESQLERAFIHQAQLSRRIARIYPQPARLNLVGLAGSIDYTPDFLVIDVDDRFSFVECKPNEKLKAVSLIHRLNAIEGTLRTANCEFSVLTERHLFDQVLQKNVARLLDYVCPRMLTAAEISKIASDIAIQQPLTYKEMVTQLGQQHAHVALANGLVFTDLREPLNDHSPIWTKDEGGWDVANYL